jgi:phage-related protein
MIGRFVKTIVVNWDTIKKTTKILWDMLKGLFQVGVNYIKEKLGPIASWVKGIFDKVKSAMEGPMKSAKTTLLKIVDAIKGAFNKMKITIPKPKIPHVSVSVGHKSIKGVDIPYPKFDVNWRAKGGYFNAPTLFGAGENGKEVLMPLDHKKNMRPFSSAVAENLKDFFGLNFNGGLAGATGSFNVVIPLNVNGREIARAIAVNVDEELKRQQELKRRGV